MTPTTTITISAFVVTLIVSYLIPLATAWITKVTASTTLKQIVTAALAAITGFLTTAIAADGTAVFSAQSLLFAIISFITANIGYVYTFKAHDIGSKIAPSKGLGGGS
jgi:hypothetical protein